MAPAFLDGELIGYAAIKAHWLDIGGKDPYSTDTVDLFQEGTIFPGVKLCGGGELVDDIYRMALANSRVPKLVAGDINAELVGVGTRRRARCWRSSSAMGGALPGGRRTHVRPRRGDRARVLRAAPRRRLPRRRHARRRRRGPDPVPFEVVADRRRLGRHRRLLRRARQRPGPVNCTLPKTVAVARVAIGMLAGAGEPPNEGHQRPIRVHHQAGHAVSPAAPGAVVHRRLGSFQALETILAASRPPSRRRRPPQAAATSARSSGGARTRAAASRGPTARRTRSAKAATPAVTAPRR